MPNLITIILLILLLGISSAQADGKASPPGPAQLNPEDLKVVAVMDILEMMDLAEEMDLVIDINYLIEEDQNESQTD